MTKTELKKFRSIQAEIEQLKENIARLENQIKSAPVKEITDMPHAQIDDFDKIGTVIAKADELRNILHEKLTELLQLQIDIERSIYTLDPIERTLIRYRYIYGLKWEEICMKMMYSWNVVHSIHRKALIKLDERK